jgi:signal transduction histidine kinase
MMPFMGVRISWLIFARNSLLARFATRPAAAVREFEALSPVFTDKQKVLQILVNLVSNAKNAILEADRPNGRMILRIVRAATGRVRVEVIDNGVGIEGENLTRIFSHGFTTRKDGHGLGLHNAANLAREMDGTLTVESPGPGLGACFILELAARTKH